MEIRIKTESLVDVENGNFSGDEYDSRPDTATSWQFSSAKFTEDKESWSDLFLGIGEDKEAHRFVVVAVWSDGDSFGNDYQRNAEAVAAYPSMLEAVKAQQKMEKPEPEGYMYESINFGNGFNFPPPWYGYFESLDFIEILEVK